MLKIASLHIYPIKSCAGINTESMAVVKNGPWLDREFMLIDDKGTFISQRSDPKLCLVKTALRGHYLVISIPGYDAMEIDIYGGESVVREVQVWKDRCVGLMQNPAISARFSHFLDKQCALVRCDPHEPRHHHSEEMNETFPVGYADGYPFLVISKESLDDLNTRLATPIPMNRFRPNIVVEGGDPYAEDTWAQFSDTRSGIWFSFAKRCVRCAIPTTDQETAERGPEPQATLLKYRADRKLRGTVFGANYVHRTNGCRDNTLRVGSELIIDAMQ